MIRTRDPPNICNKVATIKKEKAQVALDITCKHKAMELQYKEPRILHIVSGILIRLYFYTEYPNRVGYIVNIFLLPDLSL